MPRGVANIDTQVVSRAQEMKLTVACPRPPKGCGQPKGAVCRMPKGNPYPVGHGARWDRFYQYKRRHEARLKATAETFDANSQER